MGWDIGLEQSGGWHIGLSQDVATVAAGQGAAPLPQGTGQGAPVVTAAAGGGAAPIPEGWGEGLLPPLSVTVGTEDGASQEFLLGQGLGAGLLLYAEGLSGDLLLQDGELVQDQGLTSAILLSLFLDSYAQESPDIDDRRGWCLDDPEDRLGSQLWLLEREVASPEVAERARQYVEEALAWMVRDGLAEGVDVETRYVRTGHLAIEVQIRRGTARSWGHLWEQPVAFNTDWAGGSLLVSSN